MLGGQLEHSDLLADEVAFIGTLAVAGRVLCTPGTHIRADIVEQVVTRSGPLGVSFAHFRRVEIYNAHILGKLDLSDCIVFPVLFDGCLFSHEGESFDVSRSEVRDLRIVHCLFEGDIRGENSRVTGNLWLRDSVLRGTANLMLARVAGSVVVDGIDIEGANDAGVSLVLDGIRVDGLFQISGARLAAGLSIREALLRSQAAINHSRLGTVDPSLGTIYIQKTRFESEMTLGPDLYVDRVAGEALRSDSDVILTKLRPTRQSLELDLDRVVLIGGLQLFDVIGDGRVLLRGASLDSLQISKTRLIARGFNLDGSTVPGLESEDNRYAISADGLRVASDVQLGPDLLAVGEVRLIDASVGGQVQYKRGQVSAGVVLNLEGAIVGSALFLDDMDPRSIAHLAAASLGGIFIDPENLPHVSLLRTHYKFINDEDGRPPSIEVACKLLERDPMVHSVAPYRQLARWFSEDQGNDRASRAILIAGERRTGQGRSRGIRAVDSVWRWTVGYGYAPNRAVWPFLGLVVIATGVFGLVSGYSGFADWTAAPAVLPVGTPQTVFNPFLYALSATVPFLPDFLSPWAPANALMQVLTVMFQVLGWLLITALVAGVANRLRRRG